MGLFSSWTEKDAEEFRQSELEKALNRGLKQGQEQTMESLKEKTKELESKGLGADQILKELGLV